MASSTAETSKKVRKRAKLYLWSVAVGVLTLFVAIDLSGIGGNIEFYRKWIECGQKPVITRSGFKSPVYYEEAQTFAMVRLPHGTYFCSPLQAEAAGVSANEKYYAFPHLQQLSQDDRDRIIGKAESNSSEYESINYLQIAVIVFVIGGLATGILYYKSRQIKV